MFVDQLILYGSLLILIGIISRKFSARFGVPVLVLFLLVGMLAGSEGIGLIDFENYRLAHGIGTIALVIILFDGGLRTPLGQLRIAWKPALSLATIGVLITAVIVGFVATWILELDYVEGLLLGSIVASTDAAAVFSILRTQGVNLEQRLTATLEIESGSNDPMAIFLTVGLVEVLLGERSLGTGLVVLFLLQIGVGLGAGLLFGYVGNRVINRINLDTLGLYPVLVVTLGFITYGLAVATGGSGYLAVYVAGILLGNSRLVFQHGTLMFHDGLAWLSQIAMFVVLGLLSFPSQLLAVTWEGLAISATLMFVARPIAVLLSVPGFGFSLREKLFVSWVGLKGAVPIILATFPLLFNLPHGLVYFNVVFFVVLVSAVMQGWSLASVARWIGLQLPPLPSPAVTLEITSLRHVNADIVDYEITERSVAAHLRISELNLPEEVVIAMIARNNDIIPARGPSVLLPGDHVSVILRPEARPIVDEVFRERVVEQELPIRAGIYLPARLSLNELADLYGIELKGAPVETLESFLVGHLHQPLQEGSFLELDGLRFFVHSIEDEKDTIIGIEEIS